MPHTIRPYQDIDLPALHTINVASEPGVGAVTAQALSAIIFEGDCFVAEAAQGRIDGFLLTLGPDAAYASKNYQWFNERYENYVYVDRVAIAPDARGQSLGPKLYEHSFIHYAGKALLMGCEVNTVPPNPGSMRFHERQGFKPIGEQAFGDDYAVAYLARRLSP